ncbi:MAG TPA: proton-conducting transporter membrane subunit [Fimbriiglobus sp.]|nr:proton-conducting transporter membrane subunit [Fimbriiglobus sp.]
MNPLLLPWLELSILVPLVGAVFVSRVRGNPYRAGRWCLAVAGAALGCSLLAWLGFYLGYETAVRSPLTLDGLSAPLVPAVALLHFLTVLATARTKAARMSFGWLLVGETVRLATFGCSDPWLLIALMAASTIPPYAELVQRGKPTRVYALHMALFVGLLAAGWVLVESDSVAGGSALLLAAVLVRSGVVPAHLWVADLFEHTTFATALLYVTPIAGAYAAVRLVLPVAPEWVLQSIVVASLVTAVYAAGMAVVQREARRFFAYLFLSHASLVLVGLELVTPISLTGALCLWFSVMLSLGGLGLMLRALEARFGRLALDDYHGLYEHSPGLAVGFLLTGLASVGFPGTLGFVSAELLVDGAVEANLAVGLAVILAAAVNGIAVVRAYFRLFTGSRHVSAVSLAITPREQVVVLTLAAVILGGGLIPQPGVTSRHHAAEAILKERTTATGLRTQPTTGPIE